MLRLSTFAADVRAVVLTGLSTASSAAVAATDTVLQAIGKLQGQLSLYRLITNNDFQTQVTVATQPTNSSTDLVALTLQSGTLTAEAPVSVVTTAATTASPNLTFSGGTTGISAGMTVVSGATFRAKVVSVTNPTVVLDQNVTVASGITVTFEAVSPQLSSRATGGGQNNDLWIIDRRFASGTLATTSSKRVLHNVANLPKAWIDFGYNNANGIGFGTGWGNLVFQITPTAMIVSLILQIQEPTAASHAATKNYVDSVAGGAQGRNVAMNGSFLINQRGIVSLSGAGGYVSDRWAIGSTADTYTSIVTALTDTEKTQIGNDWAIWCVRTVITGSGGTNSYIQLTHSVEGVRLLAGKTVTLSWYAKAAVGTPVIACRMAQVFGTGGSPSATVSQTAVNKTLSTTWTRYSQTFTLPSTTGKAVGSNGDDYTFIGFTLQAGTTIAASIGGAVANATISIAQVQLEVGSSASAMERIDYDVEYARCERFYQQVDVRIVATPSQVNEYFSETVNFRRSMRTTPTLINAGYYGTPTNVAGAPTLDSATPRAFRAYVQNAVPGIMGSDFLVYASADL